MTALTSRAADPRVTVRRPRSPDPDGQADVYWMGPFTEQLIVRRELAVNYVQFNDNYDRLEGCERWARQTLRQHQFNLRQTRPPMAAAPGLRHDTVNVVREHGRASSTRDRYIAQYGTAGTQTVISRVQIEKSSRPPARLLRRSSAVGCIIPLASVARECTLWGPGARSFTASDQSRQA